MKAFREYELEQSFEGLRLRIKTVIKGDGMKSYGVDELGGKEALEFLNEERGVIANLIEIIESDINKASRANHLKLHKD